MCGVISKSKIVQMHVPAVITVIKESDNHSFKDSIHHRVGLRVIRWDGSVRNSVFVCESSYCLVDKFRTVSNSVSVSKNFGVPQCDRTKSSNASRIFFPLAAFNARHSTHPVPSKKILDH